MKKQKKEQKQFAVCDPRRAEILPNIIETRYCLERLARKNDEIEKKFAINMQLVQFNNKDLDIIHEDKYFIRM